MTILFKNNSCPRKQINLTPITIEWESVCCTLWPLVWKWVGLQVTGTCFIQKIYVPSSSLLQSKHLPFTPSSLRLNIFRLFVILSLTQLYHYTPEIFLFSTATFKYTYRGPPQTNWTRIFSEKYWGEVRKG